MTSSKKILPVVHLVDTEGPLDESLGETFRALKNRYQIDLEPTAEALEKIQSGIGVPEHFREEVMRRFSKHRLGYNRTWDQVTQMCEKLFSKRFREQHSDSLGNPYSINWFCVDFLGFEENPRHREMRPNVVFQFYQDWIKKTQTIQDQLYWHYHPIAFSKAAHRSGTNLNHYPLHYKSLNHRILDCNHFPSVFRPGYHMERVDLNVFLEQWIPFDYANQNIPGMQRSVNYGRVQNWDGAPTDWIIYHPSFHDPRRPGELKRTIARTLNVGTDFSVLTEEEIAVAFESCLSGKPTILSYADHDFRDMSAEIEETVSMIKKVHRKYKDRIDFKFCNGVEAMRMACQLTPTGPVEIAMKFDGDRLDVKLDRPFFGSQPYLAFRATNGTLYHDNFCLTENPGHYFYVFDSDSLELSAVHEIGIAVNSKTGETSVVKYDLKNHQTNSFYYNL
jgi:hypothetical protein